MYYDTKNISTNAVCNCLSCYRCGEYIGCPIYDEDYTYGYNRNKKYFNYELCECNINTK